MEIYRVTDPIALNKETLRGVTAAVSFIADGGPVRVTGAGLATATRGADDPLLLDRLPVNARDAIWSATLAYDSKSLLGAMERRGFHENPEDPPGELIVDGMPYRIARWPNERYLRVDRVLASKPLPVFDIRDEIVPEFKSPMLWAHGFWRWDWADEYIPIQKLDPIERQFTLASIPEKYGLQSGARFYLLNAIEALDEPGEWYIDNSKLEVYFWPLKDASTHTVEITLAPTILQIEGIDDLSFDGFEFDGARGAGIIVEDVREFWLRDCAIRNMGTFGVLIAGSDSGLHNCVVEDTGSTGVVLMGGDRRTLLPGRLSVTTRSFGGSVAGNGLRYRVSGSKVSAMSSREIRSRTDLMRASFILATTT